MSILAFQPVGEVWENGKQIGEFLVSYTFPSVYKEGGLEILEGTTAKDKIKETTYIINVGTIPTNQPEANDFGFTTSDTFEKTGEIWVTQEYFDERNEFVRVFPID